MRPSSQGSRYPYECSQPYGAGREASSSSVLMRCAICRSFVTRSMGMSDVIETTQNYGTTPPVLTRMERGRKVKDLDALTKEQKNRLKAQGLTEKELRRREAVIKQLITEMAEHGSLYGSGLRQEAANTLGVSVSTIDRWRKKYEREQNITVFIESKRGPIPGSRMSLEQEAIICYFYLNRKQHSRGHDGHVVTLNKKSTVSFIHHILTKFTGFTKSLQSTRRYLHRLNIADPIVVARARFGKKYLEEHLMPTLPNNVRRPNIRWQIDGRPLPIYVRYKGLVCTVTLLLIMDDYSQYIVRAGIYPRIIRDEEGFPKRADFTKKDVGVLLASAMYYAQVRPEYVYTDHGSQFMTLRELLEDLSEEFERMTTLTNSIPGRPQGRGKIERLLALFDALLKDLPSFVDEKGGFNAIQAAKRDPEMYTFERLCAYIQTEVERFNQQPPRKNGTKTRAELWTETEAMPAPPVRRMLHLVPESMNKDVAISKTGCRIDNDLYEPRIDSNEDMFQWMLALTRREHIPMRAIKLDEPLYRTPEDKGWKAQICLDPDNPYWCELVPSGSQRFDEATYNQMLQWVQNRAEEEGDSRPEQLLPFIKSFDPSELMKDVHTKEPLLPEEVATPEEPLVKPVIPPSSEEVAGKRKPRRKTAGARPSAKSTPPKDTGVDWESMPTFDDLLREAGS
ncbi:transposase [Chloroflexia bacterium SDU3-3]|nr:transposase [Chloroflexia bacterium SDU3-3]